MGRNIIPLLIGVLLAVVVPGIALTLAVDPERQSFGLAVSPFGWPSLLVVHLAATVPLALVVGCAVNEKLGRHGLLGDRWLWAVAGVVLAGLTLSGGPRIGAALDGGNTSFAVRLGVRLAWCLALELPWCLFGLRSVAGLAPEVRGWLPVLAALLAAALPPALYADGVVEARSRQCLELLQSSRPFRARAVLQGLCDLGVERPLDGKSPRALRVQLERHIRALSASVRQPLPPKATPSHRLQRAVELAQLNRMEEAEAMLRPLADSDAVALLLRATFLRDQERWEESGAAYRQALDALLPSAAHDAMTLADCVQAYDGLAFCARAQGAFAEAEAAYHEGLERLPAAAAHFHYELGRHFQAGGRPAAALEHLHTACRLHPRYAERAQPLIQDLRARTPGCLLR